MPDPACFQSAAALAEALKSAARDALPPDALLRVDRGGGLFAVGRGQGVPDDGWSDALAAADFLAAPAGRVLRATPGPAWLAALDSAWPKPPDFLCETLARFGGPPDGERLSLFALGAKGLYQPPDPSFERRLRQQAAVCLRGGGGGGLYACGLLLHLLNEPRRPAFPRKETR